MKVINKCGPLAKVAVLIGIGAAVALVCYDFPKFKKGDCVRKLGYSTVAIVSSIQKYDTEVKFSISQDYGVYRTSDLVKVHCFTGEAYD